MRLVEETPDGDSVRFVSEVDSDSLDEFLTTPCGSSSPSSRGTTSDCGVDWLSPEEQKQYYETVFKIAGGNDDIDAQKLLDDINSVGSNKRQARLARFIKSSGEDSIRLLRSLEPNTQRKLFDMDDRVSTDHWGSGDIGDWRITLAQYRRAGISDDTIKDHIENANKIATNSDIKDGGDLLKPIANLEKGSNLSPNQFRRYDNEVKRTIGYAEDSDVGLGEAKQIEVEPDFDSTSKDVDLKVKYNDGQVEYVEIKRLTGTPTKIK